MLEVCCFECVADKLIFSMDRGSCLSRNVSLIIQICKRIFLLNGGFYQAFLHIDQ